MDRSREKKSLRRQKKNWISAHELVKERLKNLKVKLPINGQIGLRDAEIGQSKLAGRTRNSTKCLKD